MSRTSSLIFHYHFEADLKNKTKKRKQKNNRQTNKKQKLQEKKKKEIVKHIRSGNFNAITSPLARKISHGLTITSSS